MSSTNIDIWLTNYLIKYMTISNSIQSYEDDFVELYKVLDPYL